jgi:hypothetical protein
MAGDGFIGQIVLSSNRVTTSWALGEHAAGSPAPLLRPSPAAATMPKFLREKIRIWAMMLTYGRLSTPSRRRGPYGSTADPPSC